MTQGWKTEAPTEPGEYWVSDGEKVFRASVYISEWDTSLRIDFECDDIDRTPQELMKNHGITHWFGPLYVPEPPQ